MKTIPVSIILASLLAPAAVLAQTPGAADPRPEPGKRGGTRPFQQAWKAADSDGDGFISRGEFAAMPRIQNVPEDKRAKLFERLDKNSDDRLSRSELERPGHPPQGRHPEPARRLAELDADRSGGVSLEEFKAGPLAEKLPPERIERIFQRLDSDGDGQITPKDRPEPPRRGSDGLNRGERPGPPPEPRRLFQQLDKDGDKALSFEEFRLSPAVKNLGEDEQEDRFEALDANHDGKLTPGEMPGTPRPRGPRPLAE